MVYSYKHHRSRPSGQQISRINYTFFILNIFKCAMFHFDPHLTSIHYKSKMECAKDNSEAQILKKIKFLQVCSGAGAREDTTIFHFRTNGGFVNEEEGKMVGSPPSRGDSPEQVAKLSRLNTKTGKLKVITLCNTTINVSILFMEYNGKNIPEFIYSSSSIGLLIEKRRSIERFYGQCLELLHFDTNLTGEIVF